MRPLAVQLALLVLATVGKLNADDSHNEPEPTTATLAIVPMYVFPNGSLQVADIDLLKSNASRQAEGVSNVTLGDVRQDNRTRETQLRNRNRDKVIHTNVMLQRILFQLGLTSPPSVIPNVTPSSLNGEAGQLIIDAVAKAPPPTKSSYFINEQENEVATAASASAVGSQQQATTGATEVNEFATSEIYAQRLQSFYPSCGSPNFTNPSVWSSPNQREMRLYFDMNIPKSTNSVRRTHTTITWAKLRLFVTAGPGCRQQHSATDSTSYRELLRCDNRVNISLFQYVRPLSDHRGERRRMLDSKMVPASYRGPIEFNMLSVINHWQRNQDSNYGLVLLVEDAQGLALPPAMYLQQMNCSDHEIPIPNLAELYSDKVLNRTLVNGQIRARYPTLDMMSVESARDDQAFVTTLRSNSHHRQVPVSPTSLLFQLPSNGEQYRAK